MYYNCVCVVCACVCACMNLQMELHPFYAHSLTLLAPCLIFVWAEWGREQGGGSLSSSLHPLHPSTWTASGVCQHALWTPACVCICVCTVCVCKWVYVCVCTVCMHVCGMYCTCICICVCFWGCSSHVLDGGWRLVCSLPPTKQECLHAWLLPYGTFSHTHTHTLPHQHVHTHICTYRHMHKKHTFCTLKKAFIHSYTSAKRRLCVCVNILNSAHALHWGCVHCYVISFVHRTCCACNSMECFTCLCLLSFSFSKYLYTHA